MALAFNGREVAIKDFKGNGFTLYGFELDGVLWLLLDEIIRLLEVSTEEVKELQDEEPEDFGTLSDGRAVIQEGGFNYLALFVSDTPQAKEFRKWTFGHVIPSIMEKGYYSIGEEEKE